MALPVAAQTTSNPQQNNEQIQTGISSKPDATANTNAQATTTTSEADHQPLELQQKEGFWGKLNPFARKKYVKRQMAPVVGRVNELDELTASNSRNIKDVDARATEGLRLANEKVSTADSHAVEATNRANLANETATKANTRIENVQTALQNVDKYDAVTEAEIRFRPGQTKLSKKAQEALDEIAQNMKDQKGMIVEVQGFSAGRGSASIENSQKMAESVVRYFVINHDIPVYRIYTVGMGNVPLKTAEGKTRRLTGGRVQVSLLKNGIGDLNQQMAQAPASSTPANGNESGYGVNNNTSLPQNDQQPAPEQQQKQPETQAPPKQ
jgi:outer membrane protein OmpA-like peptidoglycan-associated protein